MIPWLVGLLACGEPAPPPDPSPVPPSLPGAPADRPHNLILVVLDTLRADHVGYHGNARQPSPALDAFAARGVRLMAHHSHTGRTAPSVATLFTGLPSPLHGVVNPLERWNALGTLGPEQRTLAEWLSDRGYATAGLVTNQNLDARFGFDQGFDWYTFHPWEAPGLTAEALSLLDRRGPAPFFLYLHYMDTHSPYETQTAPYVDPAYAGPITGAHEELDAILMGRYAPNDADLAHLRALYDQELAFFDQAFGALVKGLEARGLLQDTVIAFTSDHGEEFWDHGALLHGYTLFEEQLHVPFAVVAPGLAPRAIEGSTRHADVPRLLMELADVPAGRDHALPGEALAPVLRGAGEPEPVPIVGHAQLRAVRTVRSWSWTTPEGLKLIAEELPEPRVRLYDLGSDPGEQRDLAADRPGDVAALQGALAAWRAQHQAAAPRAVDLTVDEVEALKALGYIDPEGE